MVPVEKMQELGAVVKFWQARVDALTAEQSMLVDMRAHGRPGGDRYAADRLLREIKKKSAEVSEAERSLRLVERELVAANESLAHLVRDNVLAAASGRSAH